MKCRVIRNWTIYAQLALEDRLLSAETPAEPELIFFESDRAVVIGKNQNPWRECRLVEAMQSGFRVARRVSGGGAVTHLPGNLNYAVILPRTRYKQADFFDALKAAFAEFDLNIAVTPQFGLTVGNRKFSGSAFAYRGPNALHHGTLLIDADLRAVEHVLGGMDSIEGTFAVRSTPAQVTNLSDEQAGFDEPRAMEIIRRACARYVKEPVEPTEEIDEPSETLKDDIRRLSSYEWVYGRTPGFECRWGDEGQHHLVIRRGRIDEIRRGENAEPDASAFWKGVIPDSDTVLRRWEQAGGGPSPVAEFFCTHQWVCPLDPHRP